MLALFRSFSTNNVLLKEMNHLFVQKINPTLAKMEWIPQDENYDYHQEIARSAFADMLHDSERVSKNVSLQIHFYYKFKHCYNPLKVILYLYFYFLLDQ